MNYFQNLNKIKKIKENTKKKFMIFTNKFPQIYPQNLP